MQLNFGVRSQQLSEEGTLPIISSDELKAERVAAMGPELGEIYHQLTNEISWILLKWHQYGALFGTTPERVELLNKAAPLFFVVVQDTFWDDILIHLCRLTDPATLGRKANLSITRLPPLIQDSAFAAEIAALVSVTVASTGFARDWRNRRIAHADLSLSTAATPIPLAHASRASVGSAIDSLNALLKRVHQHFVGRDIDLDLADEPGDADSLLRILAEGVEARRARLQRFEEGRLTPDDWRGPPAI